MPAPFGNSGRTPRRRERPHDELPGDEAVFAPSTPYHVAGDASFERGGNASQNYAPPAAEFDKRRAILRFRAIFFGYAAKIDPQAIKRTPVDDCGRRFPRSVLSRQKSSRTFGGIAAIFLPCRLFRDKMPTDTAANATASVESAREGEAAPAPTATQAAWQAFRCRCRSRRRPPHPPESARSCARL